MCTLVTEVISSNKSWDEIKDILRLKLCKADIHMYTSWSMEIQQCEKESLAAYIHWFRTAAKRCNFTNDVVTIQIFIKGLKNTYSLATCIYENQLQMFNDAISEAEKLNTVQQLTATITPSSMVNMMTNDKDKCFQCQKHGHIARHCPNIRCFECDDYGHIVMDCSHKIPPLQTPAKHHQSKLHKGHHARSSSRHFYEDRDRKSHSRSQPCFHRHCSSSHQDSYGGHPRSQHRDIAIITGVAHTPQIPHTGDIAINLTATLHIDHTSDHLHTEAHHTTPEIEACHVHIHHINPHDETHIGHTCSPVDHKANHMIRRTTK